MEKILLAISFACFCAFADSSDTAINSISQMREPDSAGNYIVLPESRLQFDREFRQPHKYNPLVAAGLSALVPGAGQVYCSTKEIPARKRGRIIKGGLFLAANGALAGVVANRVLYYNLMNDIVEDTAKALGSYHMMLDTARDSVSRALNQSVYLNALMNYELVRYERRMSRYAMYQAIGWNAGLYLFNILDAVNSSNFFYNDKGKNPLTAAWLSAIPCLGLGQLYNGSITKAGMVWMTQTMLLDMAYNYNRLMNDAAEQRTMMADSTNWRHNVPEKVPGLNQMQWEGKYNDAFLRRNLYLWYAVFFYFYQIFDAAVDAHLHDYQKKIQLDPAYNRDREQFGLCLNFVF